MSRTPEPSVATSTTPSPFMSRTSTFCVLEPQLTLTEAFTPRLTPRPAETVWPSLARERSPIENIVLVESVSFPVVEKPPRLPPCMARAVAKQVPSWVTNAGSGASPGVPFIRVPADLGTSGANSRLRCESELFGSRAFRLPSRKRSWSVAPEKVVSSGR